MLNARYSLPANSKFKTEILQRGMGELRWLREILRSQRQAAQTDFMMEKVERVSRRVRRESRVTAAAERRLKRPLKRDSLMMRLGEARPQSQGTRAAEAGGG